MKMVHVIGVLVGVAVVSFAVFLLINGGWTGPAPFPAAVGHQADEGRSPADHPSHLTNHPIIVSPSELPRGASPGVASPASGPTWPESPARERQETRPSGSFLPSMSFAPIPDRIGTLPAESGSYPSENWPAGRLPQLPDPSRPSGTLRTLDPTSGSPHDTSPPSYR